MNITSEDQMYNVAYDIDLSFFKGRILTPYSLSYLGSRDYIDISSIWRAFSQANANKFDCYSIQQILIRIIKPLKNKVFSLRVRALDILPYALKGLVSAEIFYTLNSVDYRELLIQGADPIVDRRPEKALNLNEYLDVSENEVRFIKPLNSEHYYNYMVAGRVLIEQFMVEPPRVASCYVEKLISIEKMSDVTVSLGRRSANFLQIKYSFNNKPLNEVLVCCKPTLKELKERDNHIK